MVSRLRWRRASSDAANRRLARRFRFLASRLASNGLPPTNRCGAVLHRDESGDVVGRIRLAVAEPETRSPCSRKTRSPTVPAVTMSHRRAVVSPTNRATHTRPPKRTTSRRETASENGCEPRGAGVRPAQDVQVLDSRRFGPILASVSRPSRPSPHTVYFGLGALPDQGGQFLRCGPRAGDYQHDPRRCCGPVEPACPDCRRRGRDADPRGPHLRERHVRSVVRRR